MLPNESFKYAVQDAPQTGSPEETAAAMGDYYPRVYRCSLDQFLVAEFHFALPTRLRRIHAQKSNQLVRMRRDVVRDVTIIHPRAAQLSLAAKHDCLRVGGRCGAIVFIANGQVHFHAGAGAAGLTRKVLGEILRVFPRVTVNINDHDNFPRASTLSR